MLVGRLYRRCLKAGPTSLLLDLECMAVAVGVLRAYTGQELADRHGVTRQTIHVHMKQVCVFLGVDNPLSRKTK